MPKAKSGNFTLRRVAVNIPMDRAALRFMALQRSGQYSELRMVQRPGGKSCDIVGYKWPDKGARRKLGIGRAVNPSPARVTPNQVYFRLGGKNLLGWVSRSMARTYEVTYKVGAVTKTARVPRNLVKFVSTGKRGRALNPVGTCTKSATGAAGGGKETFSKLRKKSAAKKTGARSGPGWEFVPNSPGPALKKALALSRQFFGFDPRKVRSLDVKYPKAVALLGACMRVDYLSDKFDGKQRIYFHEFDSPPLLLASAEPNSDGTSLLLLVGKFKVKPEGITG